MKKLVVLTLITLLAVPVFSQIKFGLKGGVSTTSLSMPTMKSVTSGSVTYNVDAISDAKFGFHGGAFLRLSLLGFYVQPEVLFSTRTNEYTITNVQSTAQYISKQTFNKLDIPVLIGFKLGPVRLNAGPAASILINSPKSLIDNADFKSLYSSMTVGYQAGLGVDLLKRLTFDLRYEGSLKKYQNQIENLTGTKVTLDDRPNAFLLSLGFIF